MASGEEAASDPNGSTHVRYEQITATTSAGYRPLLGISAAAIASFVGFVLLAYWLVESTQLAYTYAIILWTYSTVLFGFIYEYAMTKSETDEGNGQ
ncbi:hypothetical protein [Natronorubrum sediminis]|nr:hypothetical protein [Natronorubrum sediminis]